MGNLLVSFKKILSNKNTVTILGVLLGLVVLYFGYTWRVNKSTDPVEVRYAIETLVQGEKITEEKTGTTKLPRELANNLGMYRTWDEIKDLYVGIDGKIPKNSFFYPENTTPEDQRVDNIFDGVNDDETLFSLKVNYESTYQNSLQPKDYIDLYMTTNQDGKLVFGRFIEGIQIKAVKDSSGRNVFQDKDNPTEPASLIFAVKEDLFLLLSRATKLGIQFEPVARGGNYSKKPGSAKLTAQQLKEIIINQTFTIAGECTEIDKC